MPISMLIVGGGSIGERHLRCFQQIGCEMALCEPHPERRAELAERYGLIRTYPSLAEACNRTWDAAVICTPANLHVAHALQLAAHARALLIEKPLATSLDEASQLPAALRGKTVGVAYVLRVHPAVAAVRQLLSDNHLGKLAQVLAIAGQHFPTFRPAYREIYYADRAMGGGAIQDAATHLFNLVQYFTGPFEWLFCDYGRQALEGVQVEDTVHLLARASHGQVMVTVALNQFMAPNENVFQLNGVGGSAQIRFHEHRYGVCCHGGEWQWSEPLLHDRDDLFRLQAKGFLDAAAGNSTVACTLEDALHTLRLNLASIDSAGKHRLDIAAEQPGL